MSLARPLVIAAVVALTLAGCGSSSPDATAPPTAVTAATGPAAPTGTVGPTSPDGTVTEAEVDQIDQQLEDIDKLLDDLDTELQSD
jgi:uncharacterized lipoprotein YbaY